MWFGATTAATAALSYLLIKGGLPRLLLHPPRAVLRVFLCSSPSGFRGSFPSGFWAPSPQGFGLLLLRISGLWSMCGVLPTHPPTHLPSENLPVAVGWRLHTGVLRVEGQLLGVWVWAGRDAGCL